MKKNIYIIVVVCLLQTTLLAQKPWSERMTETVMQLWPDSMALKAGQPAKWIYDQGLILKAIEKVWLRSGNGKYFDYIKKSMDFFVTKEGTIRTYKQGDYNIDNITPGRNLLLLYDVLEDEKYRKAAAILREQLKEHPRTKEGGFWHKKIYPYQMWLDGLYMGEPFYAEYAIRFNELQAFDDIANQFIWMEQHARDAKTGLLYHAWDESKEQRWANKTTGQSPNFWGRAMGWYGMALVDVLEIFPTTHAKRAELINILKRYITAIKKVQDPQSGVWWQILDKGNTKGNYLEASASSMFVYTMAKAVRLGYTPASEIAAAKKAYAGVLKTFVTVDNGVTNLNRVCQVAGLGGNPYRDGSFDYYVNEPIITNDPKGLGAFILAAAEMETLTEAKPGAGKNVVLDRFFNNETKKNKQGNTVPFHYTWEDRMNSGFSLWGNLFRNQGGATVSLMGEPTAASLKKASVYIIVDPDTEKETANPQYILPQHTKAITEWVKAGGVLVLMANDSANTELDHFNQLASGFGIRFNKDNLNAVKNNAYETGLVQVAKGNAVFKQAERLFIKELASLSLQTPAKALVKSGEHTIMALANYGKGKVFAIGDPWLYNEYIDGRKLPADFDNYIAAKELASWLLQAAQKK
jgi:unsaturated rhamnogalacturonyl hydrolase